MSDYQGIFLNQWQLERGGVPFNPFNVQPPPTPEERAAVFTGSEDDLESVTSQLVASPCGIVIHGIFGIGKTIFTYEVLRRSESVQALPVYVSYHPRDSFYLLILRDVARALAGRGHDEGRLLDEILRRGEQSRATKTSGELSPEGAGFKLGTLGRETTRTESLGIHDPRGEIERLAASVQADCRRIVIAIDNLERHANEELARQAVNDIKELQRFGCSVLLSGHPLGVTRNLTSASEGGVFVDTILLEPLSATQLVEMMTKYLRLARRPGSDLAPTHPFTPIAARDIAERIVGHGLTPRSFQFACRFLLEHFAIKGEPLIRPEYLDEGFTALSRKIRRNLDELEMEALDVRYREMVRAMRAIGPLTEQADDRVLDNLNSTFIDEHPRLERLEEADVVIGERRVDEDNAEIREYRVNPLLLDEDIEDMSS